MRARTAVMITIVLAACTALAAVPVGAATPAYCRGTAPLDIDQLPERISLAGCDIVGRTIEAGGLNVTVPPPGEGRSVHALRTGGETELTVRTTTSGDVVISSQEEASVLAAAAPANDLFTTPEVVATPTSYSWSRDGTTVDATVQGKDAVADTNCGTAPANVPDRTVWYRYVARHDGLVKLVLSNVNPTGANIRAQVFVGDAVAPYRCTNEELYVGKGQAFYVRVGTVGTPASFRLKWFPPAPPQDSFAKAPLRTVPYDSYTDAMAGATLQAGEPTPSCKTTWTGTVWHRIDPGALRRLDVNGSGGGFAVYRGSTLSGLTEVACSNGTWGAKVILPATTTYYVQQWVPPGELYGSMYVFSGEPYPDAPAPCAEDSYYLMDVAGRKPLNWRYNGTNAPTAIASSALSLIKQGIGIVTGSKNDCGLADVVDAQQSHLGNTTRTATMCSKSAADGVNVVDFGSLDYGVLGIACSSWQSTTSGEWIINETDIRLSRPGPWTLKPDAPSCPGAFDLVGVVAHEAGHAFGLDHPYGQGNQTMSAYNMQCTSAFRTLGRGDVLGLRALY